MPPRLALLAAGAAAAVAVIGGGYAALSQNPPAPAPAPPPPAGGTGFAADRAPAPSAAAVELDTARARKYLAELCDIGPRVSASAGMAKQQAVVTAHFEKHGAKVTRQPFDATIRSRPAPKVPMVNLVASFNPERTGRVIVCCHYDTRPAAHQEPDQRRWSLPFVSANDGTAGVALMMELAHHVASIKTEVGLDFVLFDGEEYILDPGVPYIREGDAYFHGSRHFAAEYAKNKGQSKARYQSAILLDLCCGKNARLAVEGYSQTMAPALVAEVWGVAKKLGAKSFRAELGFQRGNEVQDDHLALNEVGIPAIDLIDFDYEHWHLLSDTADKIDDAQVREVGQVLLAWLAQQKPHAPGGGGRP